MNSHHPDRTTETSVHASLSYLSSASPRPVSYAYTPPPGTAWESARFVDQPVQIVDARALPRPPELSQQGFALWDAPTSVRDFDDEDIVRRHYYPEALSLALLATGARRGLVFDHLLRRREADRRGLSFGRRAPDGRPAVNGRVHNDYTEASGHRRLALQLPGEQLRRHAIVNIWRAINGPVLDTPLAVCDARSLVASDLVESEVRYPRRSGEIYQALYAPAHRWHYYPLMRPNEALVFKQYDSQLSGCARFVLHAAFDLPQIPADAPLRESIELRCLVLFDEVV